MGDVELAQSFQDCKVGVPSLGVDHHFAPQVVVDVIDELFHDVAPALLVGQKQAVVFLSTYLGNLAILYLCPYANATPFEYYKYKLIQWLVQQ